MNFKKVMAAVLAGTMVFGMASSVSEQQKFLSGH